MFSKESELRTSLCAAMSKETLVQQWKDMIAMFKPQKARPEAEQADTVKTVFCMRVNLYDWPRGTGTLVTTEKQNFTFGNADTFDICLHAGNMQVGDVWCSVFFDRTLNGYVVMQAMGSFHVCVTGDDEPYRHGDWSLYPEGFDYRTVAQNNLLIPVSSKAAPKKTIFHIENHYFIEMWAYNADEDTAAAPACVAENEEESQEGDESV